MGGLDFNFNMKDLSGKVIKREPPMILLMLMNFATGESRIVKQYDTSMWQVSLQIASKDRMVYNSERKGHQFYWLKIIYEE